MLRRPEHIHIGESLRYINKRYNEMVDMVDINTNGPYSTKGSINLLRGNTIKLTKDFLRSSNVPDIEFNPISF